MWWYFLNLIWVIPVVWALYFILSVILNPFIPSPLHKMPGPPNSSWLNGNMPEIQKEQGLAPHLRWLKEFEGEPFIHYRLILNHDRVLITDPDALALLLSDKELLSKRVKNYKSLSKLIGNGLVTLLGSQHTEHRKMLQPAFHFHNLKAMVATFVHQTEKLCELWDHQEGDSIDVIERLSSLTLNIIGLTAFGFEFNSLDDDSVGKEAAKRFTNIISGRTDIAQMLVFTFPPILHAPIAMFRNIQEDIEYTDELVKALIRQKRASMSGSTIDVQHNNLLDILMASQGSAALSDQELADHVKTLMFAGHETTSSLTTWVIYALTQEPDIVAQLKKELDTKLGDSPINYENLEKLPILKAVIKETLRMYPPVGIVSRKLEKKFEYKGYTIPAGTTCAISPYIMHHNPLLWNEPEKFKPSRWLSDETRHRYQFIPFLKGPRNCIGEKFAMLEASAILAIVLRKFYFSMDSKAWAETERSLRVTMRPKPSIIVKIHKHK